MGRVDPLGDRIKAYEGRETDRRAMPGLPLVVRVDGRAFSAFTAGLGKPFDAAFADLMVETARYLLEEVDGARVAYTQSDEISLVLDPFGTPSVEEVLRELDALLDRPLDEIPSDAPSGRVGLEDAVKRIRQGLAPPREAIQFMFQGKMQKLVSVTASLATARFLMGAMTTWPERCARQLPIFDSRVFQVPSRREAVAALAWREVDAMRNAVSMTARAHFSPREMHGRSSREMKAMLAAIGVDFDGLPARLRRGVYLQRRRVQRVLDKATLARIPAGKRHDGPVIRRETALLDLPPSWHLANAVEVLLDGAAPVARSFDRAA